MKKLMNSFSMFSIGVPILFAILSISNSCTKDSSMYGSGNDNGGSGTPGANEVWIQSMKFKPSVITVAAGTTITWTNKDGVDHTVTSDTDLFDSGDMGNGETFSFTFTTAGSYPYYCAFHPDMTGEVVVN
jgi:plastocyanin